ncbi:MAG: hypothetical protein Faunusvirus10_5 [Faunusvirus sp.]|jgi:hypothetical protein|uniref:Uncharacterized protein n=1 Tax=Faunusvirus sp. TaxID=2487766 RepID=A0A3G4ZWQ1_9VIRU|nr:MAG: hypothetical protein Faunusvirus10_5 [Faunusvirus sp.]
MLVKRCDKVLDCYENRLTAIWRQADLQQYKCKLTWQVTADNNLVPIYRAVRVYSKNDMTIANPYTVAIVKKYIGALNTAQMVKLQQYIYNPNKLYKQIDECLGNTPICMKFDVPLNFWYNTNYKSALSFNSTSYNTLIYDDLSLNTLTSKTKKPKHSNKEWTMFNDLMKHMTPIYDNNKSWSNKDIYWYESAPVDYTYQDTIANASHVYTYPLNYNNPMNADYDGDEISVYNPIPPKISAPQCDIIKDNNNNVDHDDEITIYKDTANKYKPAGHLNYSKPKSPYIWFDTIGHQLIKSVSFEVNGDVYDHHEF